MTMQTIYKGERVIMSVSILTRLVLLIAINMFVYNYALAKPHTSDESATMTFTMWDISTDKSYIVDLELPVLALKNDLAPFEINVLDIINDAMKTKITDLTNFRWGVVGGINNKELTLGYVGSYSGDGQPSAQTANMIAQRVKKLKNYYKANEFTGESHEVSVAEPHQVGHYLQIWQGDFWGIEYTKLEGKVGGDALTMWSFFAKSWTEFDKQALGVVTLNSGGLLAFKPSDQSN